MKKLIIDDLKVITCPLSRPTHTETFSHRLVRLFLIFNQMYLRIYSLSKMCFFLSLINVRFPEDHSQQCIRANLGEEKNGLRQLLLTLPFLLLTRQRRVFIIIIKKTIKEVLVLETQLLVHLRWGMQRQVQKRHMKMSHVNIS